MQEELDERFSSSHPNFIFLWKKYIFWMVWYKKDWSLNKVILKHVYLREFILRFYVNLSDSDENLKVKFLNQSLQDFIVESLVQQLINAIGNILFSYQIVFIFICISAINAIPLKHKVAKFNASTQFW